MPLTTPSTSRRGTRCEMVQVFPVPALASITDRPVGTSVVRRSKLATVCLVPRRGCCGRKPGLHRAEDGCGHASPLVEDLLREGVPIAPRQPRRGTVAFTRLALGLLVPGLHSFVGFVDAKAHDLITSPAFVVIKAADAVKDKTVRPNQLWQTDFTYLKVIGWGWFYLSTILDDFSRYIIAWKLCTTMRTEDVTDTLELALKASGCDQATVVHKPRLLSDNGSSYLSGDLAEWLDDQSMEHVRGAPYHLQTQGKIERWHQTLKNRILLENYYLPGDLEAQLGVFVEHYNHRRYHESLNNLTPADVYFGRGQTILLERERIKRKTIEHRRLQHRDAAA